MVTKKAAVPAAASMAALADPTRAAIVQLLAGGHRSVGDLAGQLPVTRPAVSKHLRVLEGAGLVRFHAEGTRNVYALQPEALQRLRDEIDALWQHALARYALVADNTAPAATPRRPRPRKESRR
jgi:DNA-binding transcriptional ArsR family regulator